MIVHRNDDIEEKWIVTPENIFLLKKKLCGRLNFKKNILTAI